MTMLESLKDRQVLSDQPPNRTGWREPGKALLLSLLPGLGQLYNGQFSKGALFLSVTAANLVGLLFLAFPGILLAWMAQLARHHQLEINTTFLAVLGQGLESKAVLCFWGLAVLSFVIYAAQEAYDTACQSLREDIYGSAARGIYPELCETTSGSYLFHLMALASCLIAVLFLVAPEPPRQQVTEIELVEPEPEPEPPPPPPLPRAAKPVRSPPRTVMPKPPPVLPEPPLTVPDAPPLPAIPLPQPVSDSASDGEPGWSAGQEGGVPGGVPGGVKQEVDFSSYLAEMQRRIKRAWHPPKGNESKTVTFKFKVSSDGSVARIRLVKSSGVTITDNAAKVAIEQAAPFPPLPQGAPEEVDIRFTFDYNIFNGTRAASFW